MADNKYILALDQGTTSSRAIIFDHSGHIVAQRQPGVPADLPAPGWVEHDPEEIWSSQIDVAQQGPAATSGVSAGDIAAIGITNQRETTVVWDRATGQPIHNAIVWQDRRTARLLRRPEAPRLGRQDPRKDRPGDRRLLLRHQGRVAARQRRGRARAGRARRAALRHHRHLADLAADRRRGPRHRLLATPRRTMLFNIHTAAVGRRDLLERVRHPARACCREVRPSSEVYGETDAEPARRRRSRSRAIAGDQQAATFGQACFAPGMAKNTYGTGCFMLMNTGDQAVSQQEQPADDHRLGPERRGHATASKAASSSPARRCSGCATAWRSSATPPRPKRWRMSVESSGGVYVVPAFVGLGAPYWDQYARGAILGLTRGSGRADIARATLEVDRLPEPRRAGGDAGR